MTRTARPHPMKNEGSWAKVGDKAYRHESGIEIRYNHNAWLWQIVGESFGYKTLSVAKWNAEKQAVAA
jgi:hypothetical protein